jgi:hypothetical protein
MFANIPQVAATPLLSINACSPTKQVQGQWSGQRPWFPTTTNHELGQYKWWSTAEHASSQSLQTLLGELKLLSLPRWLCWRQSHQCDMWQTRSYAQPQYEPHQHHWRISHQNAQDHLTVGFWLHSTQLSPPAAAAYSAMSTQFLLPTWRHGLATTNPSHSVWRNATGQ